MAVWTRLLDGAEPHAPAPRSGHATTLIAPTQSVLLFGGSNGSVFFDDFHVLEPAQYAALPRTRKAKGAKATRRLSGETRSSQAAQASQDSTGDTSERPTLAWKKLVVTVTKATTDAPLVASSLSSTSSSQSPRGAVGETTPKRSGAKAKAVLAHDPQLGAGRDYHTLHYVPSQGEKQSGFRVLVVGNIVVCPDDDDEGERGASQLPPVFDIEDLRIDELRVKQPQLAAQWVIRSVKSMWKPHARNAHCSALLGDQLFCFGGRNASVSAFYNDFFCFDVGLNQWREQQCTGNIPSPRAFAAMSANAATEQLFVYGGHDNKRQFGGMFMYDVRHCRWDKIQSRGEKPETRINHSLTHVTSNHLVLFGGRKRASRRNDVFLFDVSTRTWKQISRKQASDSESQSESQSVTESPATSPNDFPPGRTAHSAVLFEAPNESETKPTKRMIVFGGYAGSHTWLNDVHMLEVDPVTLMAQKRVNDEDRSSSSRELMVTRNVSSASNTSSSTARSSSRSSIEGALLDITNIAQSQTTAATKTAESTAPSTSGYTPAAVAARRRRLAEFDSKRDTPTTQMKKQKHSDSAGATSASQSQGYSQPSSQSRDFAPSTVSAYSRSGSIGVETMMVQLLQSQRRVDGNIGQLTALVREGQSLAHRDAFTTHQVFIQKQNEILESKLDAMTKRYDIMAKKVEVLEHDKQAMREKLVAAETEVYLHKKTINEMLPKLSTQVLEAVEKGTNVRSDVAQLLETKISSIHDILEDIRHSSGERTETDDSPPKRSSIFPDDLSSPPFSHPRTHTPAPLYPQTFVHDLEKKLQDAVQENASLHQRVQQLEAKLKRADRNAERIQELLRNQQEDDEVQQEEAKA